MKINKYLLFTIGPVQSYIEEARKTSDLYNGSSIIVDLAKLAYKYLSQNNIEIKKLILPSLREKEFSDLNEDKISNYFIASVTGEKESFVSFKKNIKDKIIRKYGCEFAKKYMENGNLETTHNINFTKIISQLKDIFNIYVVYEDGEKLYEEAYKNLYRKLEAYKNSRYFEQSIEDESPYKGKCSICGVRNADFSCFDDTLIDEKEKLCHACYFKRIKNKVNEGVDNNIPYSSTVEMAAKNWVEKRDKNLLKEYKDKIKKILEKKYEKSDENYFYYYDWLKDKIKPESKENFQSIFQEPEYKELFKEKPTKYYALVKADADNLGKWLSGKYKKDNNDDNLLTCQKEISKLLIKKAEKIKKDYPNNKVVYAGGDDYLVLISLGNLFKLMEDLTKEIELGNKNGKITLSKSVVIAKYNTPLEQVLRIARETLDSAKNKYEKEYSEGRAPKNATAITFITGSDTYKTGYYKNDEKTYELLKNLTEVFKDKLSRSFLFSLESEFQVMDGELTCDEKDNLKWMMESEIKRLIKRKKKSNFDNYEEIAQNIYGFLNKQEIGYAPSLDLENFFNILNIAEKLSHEIRGERGSGK